MARKSALPSAPPSALPSALPLETPSAPPSPSQPPPVSINLKISELLYGVSSFHAIVKPVSITMILSALTVHYVQRDESENSMDQYSAFDNSNEENSTASTLGLSLANGLIIISVIAAMTFVIVLLYKLKCMKLLLSYMILSSAALLLFLGGLLFETAINTYRIAIDKITFLVLMINFAVVGTISIFYVKGISPIITQGFLVITSVIMAWQFSKFDDWTAWTLLILLSLYDLCAVLTPCGPLKALVNLMSKEDAPAMPGLLYEASLPSGIERPGNSRIGNRQQAVVNNIHQLEPNGDRIREESAETDEIEGSTIKNVKSNDIDLQREDVFDVKLQRKPKESLFDDDRSNVYWKNNKFQKPEVVSNNNSHDRENSIELIHMDINTSAFSATIPKIGIIPLAIAQKYRLKILSPPDLATRSMSRTLDNQCHNQIQSNGDNGNRSRSSRSDGHPMFSVAELVSDVHVRFSTNGGRIIPLQSYNESFGNESNDNRPPLSPTKYVVLDRNGSVRRVLLVNAKGKVMQEVQSEDEDKESNSIKLGLVRFMLILV